MKGSLSCFKEGEEKTLRVTGSQSQKADTHLSNKEERNATVSPSSFSPPVTRAKRGPRSAFRRKYFHWRRSAVPKRDLSTRLLPKTSTWILETTRTTCFLFTVLRPDSFATNKQKRKDPRHPLHALYLPNLFRFLAACLKVLRCRRWSVRGSISSSLGRKGERKALSIRWGPTWTSL